MLVAQCGRLLVEPTAESQVVERIERARRVAVGHLLHVNDAQPQGRLTVLVDLVRDRDDVVNAGERPARSAVDVGRALGVQHVEVDGGELGTGAGREPDDGECEQQSCDARHGHD